MGTKKADEPQPQKVRLEFWADCLACGFTECELGNLCADELEDFLYNADICGFDVEDLGGTLTVDWEDVSVDLSQAAQECEGVATDWNEYLDTRGIYFIDVDMASQCVEFEIEGDFDPKKLTLFYRTAIYPGHKVLKILTGVSYGGERLEIAYPDEINGKGCWYWVFDDNKYTELSSSEDIEGFQPEDCDWKQFSNPSEETPRKGSKGKKSATKGGKAKKVISEIISNMVAIPGKSYKMGKYEVTQAQWEAVMGNNPSEFKQWEVVMGNNPSEFKNANNPVENISWYDCQKFIRKLNALPEVKASGLTFRLPTAEEWLYACCAGSTGDYCKLADGTEITEETLGDVAWYNVNSEGKTHPVGQKKPNAFGLYDMHGNVWEWCEDLFAADDSDRVNRGGSWYGVSGLCAAGQLSYNFPDSRNNALGFRLAAS